MLNQFKNDELSKEKASKILGGDIFDVLACRKLRSQKKTALDNGDIEEANRIQELMNRLGC